MVHDAKMRERQVFEDRGQNIKDYIKNFFTKLNDEATLKLLEEEYYDKSAKAAITSISTNNV